MTTMYEEMLVTHQPLPAERIRNKPQNCEFCLRHRAGETVMIQEFDEDGIMTGVYHHIRYCPLCGKALKRRGDD